MKLEDSGKQQQDAAEQIQMMEGIERQPAGLSGSMISQLICHPAVRTLVDWHGGKQHQRTNQDGRWTQIEQMIDSFFSQLLWAKEGFLFILPFFLSLYLLK